MKRTINLAHVIKWILDEQLSVWNFEIWALDGKWKKGYIEYGDRTKREEGLYEILTLDPFNGWIKSFSEVVKELKKIYKEYGTQEGNDQVIVIDAEVIRELKKEMIACVIERIRELVPKMSKEEKERLYQKVKIGLKEKDYIRREKEWRRVLRSHIPGEEEMEASLLLKRMNMVLDNKDMTYILNKIS